MKNTDEITIPLLDAVSEKFSANEVAAGMEELVLELRHLRNTLPAEKWQQFARVDCLTHPIKELIHQDPFTRRSFAKPRGYPGDAVLLDFIYGHQPLPEGTSPLGAAIYQYTSQAPACQSVRARRDMVATMIDEIAARINHAKVLSIACGHLREAQRSRAVASGQVGELIGLDYDPASLVVIQQEQPAKNIRTVQGSVKSLLAGAQVFTDCDFVYSLGIYDYLAQPAAAALTNLIFTMLKPGGKFLIANFTPDLRDIGYMESFMAWQLIYRDEAAMEALASSLPAEQIQDKRIFRDALQNLVFLEVVKR